MSLKLDPFRAVRTFREKLDAGTIQVGASITFSDPLISDALAFSSDFLWIDTEHGSLSPDSLHGHLLAARSHSIPAFVRLASGTVHEIKPVLDDGADGVIIPQITCAAEAALVVEHCRYRPEGQRGFGPRVPSNYGRDASIEHLEEANRCVFIAVQIENLEACENLESILEVPGVDSIVIGPSDLALAMGLGREMEHPLLLAKIEEIASRAQAAGRYVGAGMGADSQYARLLTNLGVQWVQVGGDYGFMVMTADRVMAESRRSKPAGSPHLNGSRHSESVVA